MNLLPRYFVSIAASVALVLLSLGNVYGQASKVVGDKPTFDVMLSPDFMGGTQKKYKPRNWLEIETTLNVQILPEPASKTCDKLTIKWYVAVKNPDKFGTFLLLSRQIDYLNVPLNDNTVYFSVYLSPNSLRRITGNDRGGKAAVEFVGYEVLIDGVKKAEMTNKGKAGWWNAPSDKIAQSNVIPLLTKAETPFANMWWDRYADVAPERR
jgi:hypothetical protein